MHAHAFYKRIAAWQDTEKNAPPLKGGPSVKESWSHDFPMERRHDHTRVAVVDCDIVDVGRAFLRFKPLVLNLADDCFPGGCVYTGSGAAEESIFRRSNYFRSLTLQHYPIRADEAVYSPTITVFKHSEAHGFICCPPYELDFVACPGIRHPKLTDDGHLTPEDTAALEKKIELVLQVAYRHGHKVLVLGAMGCGAWKNPPHDVAAAFKRVLDRHEGVFRLVVFAIKRGTEAGYTTMLGSNRPDNYATFQGTFATDQKSCLA